jgi:hypothetical protein
VEELFTKVPNGFLKSVKNIFHSALSEHGTKDFSRLPLDRQMLSMIS